MIPPLASRASAAGSMRAVVLVAILILAAGTFCYMALWRTWSAPDFDVNDFKAYYTGALALHVGRPDLLYPDASTLNLGLLPDQPWVRFAEERGVPHPSGYIYPPFLAVVMRPLAALPYHRANQLWFLLNVLLFAGSVAALAGWRARGVGFTAGAGVLFVALVFYPVLRAFKTGQVSLLILFLLAAGLWCLNRKRDAAAGVLVGLAAAVKLTPGIMVLYFLAVRRYRAALASIAAGAGCLLVSIAGAGWSNHVRFLEEMLPALSRGAATFANQSLPGFMARLGLDTTMNAFQFVDEPAWLRLAARAASIAVLAASLWLARRLGARGKPEEGYALVALSSLIASPISWEHHYALALVPIAVVITAMADPAAMSTRQAVAACAACVLMGSNAYDLIRYHLPYAPARVLISYGLFGALALWAVLARRALRAPGEAPA